MTPSENRSPGGDSAAAPPPGGVGAHGRAPVRDAAPPVYPPWRYLVAVFIGLVGSVFIWIVTPYNDFILRNTHIADSYLPVVAIFPVLVLALLLNPVLRKTCPRHALDSRQLMLALGMMLVACALPGQGLLRMLPYSLARVPLQARSDERLAKALNEEFRGKGFFPDKIEFGADTPVAEGFIMELPEGAPIPWGAWVRPLIVWGTLLVAVWLLLIGLGLIVFPQWKRNERLAFPLIDIQQELVRDPKEGDLYAEIYHSKAFWIASGTVFLLYLLQGLKGYYPDDVPAIQLNWDLSRFFTEEPWNRLPWHIKNNKVHFIFVGAAFFMSSRVGFSIWFFVIAYGLYGMLKGTYAPPYRWGTSGEHRFGAMIAMAIAIVWLGRAHWRHVFRCTFRGAHNDEERRDRAGTVMLLVGAAGMWAWLMWAGVQTLWAFFFVAFGFMISLVITRIVAETGMPFVRLQYNGYHISFIRMAPIAWLKGPTVWLTHIIVILFPVASRTNVTTLATHAVGMDPKSTPRDQTRLSAILLGLLVVGLVVCGGAHLQANYRHSMSIDGVQQPVNAWGTDRLSRANRDLVSWKDHERTRQEALGRAEKETDPEARAAHLAEARKKGARPLDESQYNRLYHIIFGASMAGALEWACLASPRWMLHPIGLLMVNSFYANVAWASIFFGWLAKVLLMRYGGSQVYKTGRAVFLGLIVGEVFAATFWGIVPAVLAAMGRDYIPVEILPR